MILTAPAISKSKTKTSALCRCHDSQWWCGYFLRQKRSLLRPPWSYPTRLSEKELSLVSSSLQEFQQGEGMEGGHFFRVVEREAQLTGDDEYRKAHRLFMAEEKRHSRDLGAFLDREGIPRLSTETPRNRLFCFLGRRCGFELILVVVLNIEIIAQTYYGALLSVTKSPLLRRICTQILRDEAMHVRFHCERLAYRRRFRGRSLLILTRALDFVLFTGAWLICLWGHRSVLSAGGLTFRRYWNVASKYRSRAARIKNPHAYRWPG